MDNLSNDDKIAFDKLIDELKTHHSDIWNEQLYFMFQLYQERNSSELLFVTNPTNEQMTEFFDDAFQSHSRHFF